MARVWVNGLGDCPYSRYENGQWEEEESIVPAMSSEEREKTRQETLRNMYSHSTPVPKKGLKDYLINAAMVVSPIIANGLIYLIGSALIDNPDQYGDKVGGLHVLASIYSIPAHFMGLIEIEEGISKKISDWKYQRYLKKRRKELEQKW